MIRGLQRPREALPEVLVLLGGERGRERHERGHAEFALLGHRGCACACLRVACIIGYMHASEVYSTRLEELLPCGTTAAQNGADVELPH
jgi:hypothetical protein